MADGERRRVRLFGQPQSAEAYALRDYLQRSVVAFDWVELASDSDCQLHLGLPELKNVRLPVVELPDGKRLFAPSLREVADSLGWVSQPKFKEYDLSIYGAGPAGLSAAVYGRWGLRRSRIGTRTRCSRGGFRYTPQR
jgi:thioredoxin reductase (NADPH)